MADILDKYFKMTILRMLKELRENMEKVEKKYGQDKNMNKDVDNLKRKQKEILSQKVQ